jgi:hypothetical protein
MARKNQRQPEIFIAPLLVSKAEAARLLSVSAEAVDQLIDEGHLLVRTLAGQTLVRFDRLCLIASERDPEPIHYPAREAVQV